MAYDPTVWETYDVITKERLNKLEQGARTGTLLSGTDINTDKDWNGKNISNIGKISPKTMLVLFGNDPVLITKSGAPSFSITFGQQIEGIGHVRVVFSGTRVDYCSSGRIFKILKNEVEIWSYSQGCWWNGDWHESPSITLEAFADLEVELGDILTFSISTGVGTATIYTTPLVAPYGIAE